jgi:hypothetical protein
MLTFTSGHHTPGRVYRVTDPGDPLRLARVEYLRDGIWREARHYNTREIAHCLVHGEPSAALSDSAATRVAKLAASVDVRERL